MLKHRVIVIVFLSGILLLIGADIARGIHWLWYAVAVVAFLSVEFYGSYFVHSNFHIAAICRGNTAEKVVALTFDDGPMPGRTEKVLNVLKKFDVTATFFLIGNRIGGNEALVRSIDAAGHLIGNHSYEHSFLFDLQNSKQLSADLETCSREIEKVTGKKPKFFRPPYGVTTPGLAKACKYLNFDVVGWNVRSLDTTIKDKVELMQRVKSRIKPGAVILFHDTVEGIEVVLEELLRYLAENNYRVVSLDKLINRNAYS